MVIGAFALLCFAHLLTLVLQISFLSSLAPTLLKHALTKWSYQGHYTNIMRGITVERL